MTSIAYWPGDLNPASFQTLAYSTLTNTLTLTPFGNSVVLNPVQQNVSTLNASTINGISASISTVNSFIENTTTTNSQTVNTSTVNAQTINNTTVNNQTVNTSTVNAQTINNTTVNNQTVNTSTVNSQTINTSTINISTINGQPLINTPVVNYVDPYGSGFVVSTLGTLQPVSIFNISTVAGHTYLVNVEYAASNTGGGGANDLTAIAIQNNNNLGTPYGKATFIDSWAVLQTYDNRYNSACGFFTTLANSGGSANINLNNLVATGNTQNVSIFGVSARDMGVPQNNF